MQKSDSMKESPSQFIQRLESLADTKYRNFSAHIYFLLIPICSDVCLCFEPWLREIAKGDWRAFLNKTESDYMEETMIRGFVKAYAKMNFAERLQQIATFVPLIQNWSVCDSFCATLRFLKDELPALRLFPRRLSPFGRGIQGTFRICHAAGPFCSRRMAAIFLPPVTNAVQPPIIRKWP